MGEEQLRAVGSAPGCPRGTTKRRASRSRSGIATFAISAIREPHSLAVRRVLSVKHPVLPTPCPTEGTVGSCVPAPPRHRPSTAPAPPGSHSQSRSWRAEPQRHRAATPRSHRPPPPFVPRAGKGNTTPSVVPSPAPRMEHSPDGLKPPSRSRKSRSQSVGQRRHRCQFCLPSPAWILSRFTL